MFFTNVNIRAQEIKKKTLMNIKEQAVEMVKVLKLEESKKEELVKVYKDKYLHRLGAKKKLMDKPDEYKEVMKKLNKDFVKSLIEICSESKYKEWVVYTRKKKKNQKK